MQERPRKQPRRAAQKQHGITHRLIRRLSLNGVGSTDEQSRQQSKRAQVEPMQRLQRASVEPVIEHRMIRQNQAHSSVQLSRGTAKRRREHRLNRRQQNPSVGAIDQRDHKAKSAEHRLNRRRQTSIRRSNGKNSTQRQIFRLHRFYWCLWNKSIGATKPNIQNPKLPRSDTPVDPTRTTSKRRFIRC